MDPVKMKQLGFTHILNAAEGRKYGQINTSATYYEEAGIHYQGFSIIDNPTYKIGKHFEEAIKFLEEALSNKKSKSSILPSGKLNIRHSFLDRVYVHCQQVKRSCERK